MRLCDILSPNAKNVEYELSGLLYPLSDPDRSDRDFLCINMCDTLISFPKVDYVISDLAASERVFRGNNQFSIVEKSHNRFILTTYGDLNYCSTKVKKCHYLKNQLD